MSGKRRELNSRAIIHHAPCSSQPGEIVFSRVRCNLLFRTLGMDKVLSEKLSVKYIGNSTEKASRKRKRSEKFKSQVKKGVEMLMVR